MTWFVAHAQWTRIDDAVSYPLSLSSAKANAKEAGLKALAADKRAAPCKLPSPFGSGNLPGAGGCRRNCPACSVHVLHPGAGRDANAMQAALPWSHAQPGQRWRYLACESPSLTAAQCHEALAPHTATRRGVDVVLRALEAGVAVYFQPNGGLHLLIGNIERTSLCPPYYGVQS